MYPLPFKRSSKYPCSILLTSDSRVANFLLLKNRRWSFRYRNKNKFSTGYIFKKSLNIQVNVREMTHFDNFTTGRIWIETIFWQSVSARAMLKTEVRKDKWDFNGSRVQKKLWIFWNRHSCTTAKTTRKKAVRDSHYGPFLLRNTSCTNIKDLSFECGEFILPPLDGIVQIFRNLSNIFL